MCILHNFMHFKKAQAKSSLEIPEGSTYYRYFWLTQVRKGQKFLYSINPRPNNLFSHTVGTSQLAPCLKEYAIQMGKHSLPFPNKYLNVNLTG